MLDYNKPFPKRLRKLLEEAKISQQKLADAVGVTQQAIGKWSSGKSEPDMSYFKRIAEFFGVSYEYLYGDSKSKKRENLLLSDELGLSDEAVEKLREWALDYPADDDEDVADEVADESTNDEVFEDLSDESTRYVSADDFGDDNNVATFIKAELTPPAILSYMLERDGFELFLERFRQCLCERVDFLQYEQKAYEELANIDTAGFAICSDEEAEYHARQVGKRLINAGDLSHFYRKLAVEALEVVMNDLHDDCAREFAETCGRVDFSGR